MEANSKAAGPSRSTMHLRTSSVASPRWQRLGMVGSPPVPPGRQITATGFTTLSPAAGAGMGPEQPQYCGSGTKQLHRYALVSPQSQNHTGCEQSTACAPG